MCSDGGTYSLPFTGEGLQGGDFVVRIVGCVRVSRDRLAASGWIDEAAPALREGLAEHTEATPSAKLWW